MTCFFPRNIPHQFFTVFIFYCFHATSFFFFNLIFLLYNTVLVLPYIDMNPPQVYMSSQPWTPLPLPSSYHLSGSSQCTSPKHPVSYIEPRLAIRFLHDSIHVSMPFSQITYPLTLLHWQEGSLPLAPLADDTIFYIGNPKKKKKRHQVIQQRLQDTKISKSVLFLYASNEQSKNENNSIYQ